MDRHVLLQTDIVGSSALWANEDERAPAAIERYLARCQRHVEAAGGTVHELMGDGLFATFPDADAAVAAARKLAAPTSTDPFAIYTRVGLHFGRLAEIWGNPTGWGRNELSRVVDAATSERVVASPPVVQLAPDCPWTSGGRFLLKDFPDPVELFVLDVDSDAASAIRAPRVRAERRPRPELLGRDDELVRAQQTLDSQSVLVVDGPPGVGTSAFAYELAHRHAEVRGIEPTMITSVGTEGTLPALLRALRLESADRRRDLSRITAHLLGSTDIVVVDPAPQSAELDSLVDFLATDDNTSARLLLVRPPVRHALASRVWLSPIDSGQQQRDPLRSPTGELLSRTLRDLDCADSGSAEELRSLVTGSMGLPAEAVRLAGIAAAIGTADAVSAIGRPGVDDWDPSIAALPDAMVEAAAALAAVPAPCTLDVLRRLEGRLDAQLVAELVKRGLVISSAPAGVNSYAPVPKLRSFLAASSPYTDRTKIKSVYLSLTEELAPRLEQPLEADASAVFFTEFENIIAVAEEMADQGEIEELTRLMEASWNFALLHLSHRLLRIAGRAVRRATHESTPEALRSIAALAEWLGGDSTRARQLAEPILADRKLNTTARHHIAASCAATNAAAFDFDPIGFDAAFNHHAATVRDLGVASFRVNLIVNEVLSAVYIGDHERAQTLAARALADAKALRNTGMLGWARYAMGFALLDRHSSDLTHLTEAARCASTVQCRWVEGLASASLAVGLLDRDRSLGAAHCSAALEGWVRADSPINVGHVLEIAALYADGEDLERRLVAAAAACGRITPPLPAVALDVDTLRRKHQESRQAIRLEGQADRELAIARAVAEAAEHLATV